jgi:hypothetical protein
MDLPAFLSQNLGPAFGMNRHRFGSTAFTAFDIAQYLPTRAMPA